MFLFCKTSLYQGYDGGAEMKIGIFSDTYMPQINGVVTSIQMLKKQLEKRGHEVYVFTPYDPKQKYEPDSHVFRLPSMPFVFVQQYRMCLVCPPQILRKIHALHLDIIHTQTEFSMGFLGKMVSKICGVPMVHTYHTMYEDYVHYIANGRLITQERARDFSRMFCNTAMVVVAPTKKTKLLLESYGVRKPISIIPTGIDTDCFCKENYEENQIQQLRHSLGLSQDTHVVLSIGRVAKEKSIDVVIRALPALIAKLPNTKMVIVGEGDETENLQHDAKSLGISEHVLFTGSRPWEEIGQYYQLGDVFCSASLSETQGLTFAEAMAAGIPVVARRDECIANIMTDGVSGMFFDQAEQLSDLLYHMLTDKALCKRLSEAAKQEIQTLSAERFAEHMETLYRRVVAAYDNAEHIESLPHILGARTVHRIKRFPRKLVHHSSRLAERWKNHIESYKEK